MSKTLDNKAVAYVVSKVGISLNQVISTCNLLFIEDCTIPFISRYRKEATNNLDEVQIRDIQEGYEEFLEIEKRRAYILDTIKKMEKLTPELEKKILAAQTLTLLEDLYAPYKSKKKTKATIAKEKGLEPLAELIKTSKDGFEKTIQDITKNFVAGSEGKVKDLEEAINGACDIIVEEFVHNADTKDTLRKQYWRSAKIKSSMRKGAEEVKDYLKFKDFFEFEENISQLQDPKNTHRFMAMRRGMNLKVLKIEIILEGDYGVEVIEANHFPNGDILGNYDLLLKLAKKAFDSSISSSLDLELKTELKKVSDTAAIDVFGVNLRNLLLQPYLGSKAVLAIDPGIRTGCKVVVIDKTGKFIGDHVIYPFAPKFDEAGSKLILTKLIEAFEVEYIAIGNGTNGRETLEFIEENIKAVKEDKVKATIISEAGASIYSASDIARKEFPDKDVTVRGAVSIARRFQDPLAELVKLDPKSIGVGQYQHDVNQIKLKKSLTGVVEGCVNFVGVDLNTASAPLLSYISGIGPSVAENIVKFREKNGQFKNRKQLLKVTRYTNKVFEQSAGFLRIYNGDNPLDGTFIHPERYSILEQWTKNHGHELAALVNDEKLISSLTTDSSLKTELGALTFDDIVKSLQAPKQDPRSEFKSIEFRKDIRKISDLKLGEWYTGVVNNITNFGAFVDMGVKESGLLHISQIADEFVENPLDKLKVGQELKVRVIEVDLDRKRVSLSCKSDSDVEYNKNTNKGPRPGAQNKAPKQQPVKNLKNNAFAGLAGLKLK
jgi:uncharacterized protein